MSARGYVERPVLFGPEQDQVAVLTVPDRPSGVGLLLMNAGLVHRVGPNRLNVELARRVARDGHLTLRLDLAGFGDSPSRAEGLGFEAGAVRDLRQAMDWLRAHHGIERFVCAGLCSGADVSLELAAADPAVRAAVLVDCFSYDTRLSFLRGYAHRALRRRTWKGLAAGAQSDLRDRCVAKVKSVFEGDAGTKEEAANKWVQPPPEQIARTVDRAVDNGARLHLAYSGGPAYDNYLLNLKAIFRPHLEGGRADLVRFKAADHTFTMAFDRRRLVEQVAGWVDAVA